MSVQTTSVRVGFLLCAIIALAVGCADTTKKSKKTAVSEETKDPNALFSDTEIIDSEENTILAGTAGKTTKSVTTAKSPTWSVPGSPQVVSQAPAQIEETPTQSAKLVGEKKSSSEDSKATAKDNRRWGIVLLTFSGDDHQQLAEASCVQLRRKYQLLADAFVREKSNGSVVMVGRFTGTDDPAAKPMVKQVHALIDGNERPFARSFLTRVDTGRAGPMGAFDLRRARLANPNSRSLYSIEVAMWSDFGSGEITVEEIRRKAEGYTTQLRAQGFPAFFHHDDDRRTSIVTVGLFGEEAYDAKTTLFSEEVNAVKKRFPKLLVNGEELLRPVRKGSQETVPEKSLLVEVPR